MPTIADDRTTLELSSPSGLRAILNANGSLCRLDCDAIALALFVGNEIEGGPANLYLRRHASNGLPCWALPAPPASASIRRARRCGDAAGGATSAI
jgi:hypothetical protein